MSRIVFDATHPASQLRAALAGSRLSPYWLDDAAHRRLPPTGDLVGRAVFDLAVVGGGYTGLWTALLAKLRDPGLRVALLEGGTCGWAASGRNGGFVEASLTHGQANGLARWPKEYPLLERLGLDNLDQLQAQVAELGIDCEFERTGSLAVAVEPYQAAALRDESRAPNDDQSYLDTAAIQAQVNSPTYLAGVWDKSGCALAHPAKLALGLARAAVEAGVEVFEHTRVEGVDQRKRGGELELTTERAVVRAGRAALATNVFPALLPRYRRHTVPVYDYAVMTEPLSRAQLAEIGWRNRQGVSDVANQFHYYRLTSDNRILWGGWEAAYPSGGRMSARLEDAPHVHAMLVSHLLTTFPQLEGVRMTHRWAGAIDTSTQFSQFFGRGFGGRAAHAAGFTGLGVGASRFAARVMLDLLAGEPTELTELELVRRPPLPFPPEPLASIGINATRRALNRADHRQGRRGLFLKALDAAGLGFDS